MNNPVESSETQRSIATLRASLCMVLRNKQTRTYLTLWKPHYLITYIEENLIGFIIPGRQFFLVKLFMFFGCFNQSQDKLTQCKHMYSLWMDSGLNMRAGGSTSTCQKPPFLTILCVLMFNVSTPLKFSHTQKNHIRY